MTQGNQQQTTKPAIVKNIISNGLILGSTAFVCLSVVFGISSYTKDKIKADTITRENTRYAMLLPQGSFNNNIANDCRIVPLSDGRNIQLLTARKNNKVTGYIARFDVPGGYAIPFKMTVGITAPDFSVYYLDVDVFNETPGLGDKILRSKSDFLDSFKGANSTNRKWEVKKYGGDFDYFTGATVTPRAVTLATGNIVNTLTAIGSQKLELAPKCQGVQEDASRNTKVTLLDDISQSNVTKLNDANLKQEQAKSTPIPHRKKCPYQEQKRHCKRHQHRTNMSETRADASTNTQNLDPHRSPPYRANRNCYTDSTK